MDDLRHYPMATECVQIDGVTNLFSLALPYLKF